MEQPRKAICGNTLELLENTKLDITRNIDEQQNGVKHANNTDNALKRNNHQIIQTNQHHTKHTGTLANTVITLQKHAWDS